MPLSPSFGCHNLRALKPPARPGGEAVQLINPLHKSPCHDSRRGSWCLHVARGPGGSEHLEGAVPRRSCLTARPGPITGPHPEVEDKVLACRRCSSAALHRLLWLYTHEQPGNGISCRSGQASQAPTPPPVLATESPLIRGSASVPQGSAHLAIGALLLGCLTPSR